MKYQTEVCKQATNEPILAFVRRSLTTSKGNWSEVSRSSGVPYHTLVKIAQGVVENPRINTLQRLADHFNVRTAEPEIPADANDVRELRCSTKPLGYVMGGTGSMRSGRSGVVIDSTAEQIGE